MGCREAAGIPEIVGAVGSQLEVQVARLLVEGVASQVEVTREGSLVLAPLHQGMVPPREQPHWRHQRTITQGGYQLEVNRTGEEVRDPK